jgi:hypothetical protein
MIQAKKKYDVNFELREEEVGASALKSSSQKADQTVVRKFQEPRVLVECDFIVEVSQSVASNGKHADYIQQLLRGMLEHNKNIKNIFDIDAFEPGTEGA